MSTATTYQHLEQRCNSSYRQLFIKGTRFRADLVYRAHVHPEEPMTPEELAADFKLPVDAVLEAIDYSRSNPPEVAEDARCEEALMAARGQLDPNYKYDARPRILAPQEVVQLGAP
jgi:uncharacterized protein (DUF433 family)